MSKTRSICASILANCGRRSKNIPTTRGSSLLSRASDIELPKAECTSATGRDVGQCKAGDAFVAIGQGAQLILRDVFVDIVERSVADQFLDLDIDEIRGLFAVGAHNLRRRGNARGFVGFPRVAWIMGFLQQIGVRARIYVPA